MRAPQRRIEMYAVGVSVDVDRVEVIILGDPSQTYHVHARVQSVLATWPGFECVESLMATSMPGGSSIQIGITAKISNLSRSLDPIDECTRALQEVGITGANGFEWTFGKSRATVTW